MDNQDVTTRDRILAAALELFSANGFDATTTRQLTEALEFTPAALYYHFESKTACLEALVEPYLDGVEALVRTAGGPMTTRAQVETFFRAYGELIGRNPLLAALIDGDPAVRTHPDLGPRVARLTARLRQTLAGPHPSGLDLVRASAALGALRRPRMRLGADIDAVIGAALAALGDRFEPDTDDGDTGAHSGPRT